MTQKFTDLWETYKTFSAPSAEVTIGSKNLIEMECCLVTSIMVSIACSEKGGMAVLQVDEYLDGESLEDTLTAGAKVVIKLGYADENKLVFSGYIHQIKNYCNTSSISYEAVCLDSKGLMSQDSYSAIAGGKKLDSVISTILGKSRYSTYYSSKQIGGIPKAFEDYTAQCGESNRHFLEYIAQQIGYYFFVRQDKLIFDKNLSSVDTIELEIGNGIILSRTLTDLSEQVKKVQILGIDYDGKRITVSAQRKKEFSPSTVIGEVKTIRELRAYTKEALELIAVANMKRIEDKTYTIEAECIGMPELLPLNIVKSKQGKWEIREAVHTFDDFGYSTLIKGVKL